MWRRPELFWMRYLFTDPLSGRLLYLRKALPVQTTTIMSFPEMSTVFYWLDWRCRNTLTGPPVKPLIYRPLKSSCSSWTQTFRQSKSPSWRLLTSAEKRISVYSSQWIVKKCNSTYFCIWTKPFNRPIYSLAMWDSILHIKHYNDVLLAWAWAVTFK